MRTRKKLWKRFESTLLMLAMLLSLLPVTVFAAGTLKDLRIFQEAFEYNPLTQEYQQAYGTMSEMFSAALKKYGVTSTIEIIDKAAVAQEIGMPSWATKNTKYNLPQMTAEYEGREYTWLCMDYTVRVKTKGEETTYSWTEEQLNGTPRQFNFSEAVDEYVYVSYRWVREDRLQENISEDYETVGITFHFWDHILESGTCGESKLEIPPDCEYSNPTVELYGSNTSYSTNEKIQAAIQEGQCDKIETNDGIFTVQWPKGYYINPLKSALTTELGYQYFYIRIQCGNYEWYKALDYWQFDPTETAIKNDLEVTEDIELYMRFETVPYLAKEGYKLFRPFALPQLESESEWSQQEFNSVRSQISYPEPEGFFSTELRAVPNTWTFDVPVPVASSVDETGAVLLQDQNFTWRCIGVRYEDAEGTEHTVPHTDWRQPCSITIQDTSRFTSIYFWLYYIWEVDWDNDPPTMYDVTYDLTLPRELSVGGGTVRVFPVDKRDSPHVSIQDLGLTQANLTSEANDYATRIREGTTFEIAKKKNNNTTTNIGYLAFNYSTDTYYEFIGWKTDASDRLYQVGDIVEVDDLVDPENNTGTIQLKAQWEKIELLSNQRLAELEEELILDVLVGDGEVENVLPCPLITQWTSPTPNPSSGQKFKAQPVVLDEEETLHYRVSAGISTTLTGNSDGGHALYYNIADLTMSVNIDENLEFASANSDGTVTINFNNNNMKPIGIVDVADVTISGPDAENNYQITFDPRKLPVENGRMQLGVQAQWISNRYSVNLSQPLVLTGLDFKLKDGVDTSAGITVQSNANVKGSLHLANRFNFRFYYDSAYSLLHASEEWQEAFNGSVESPTSLVHAVQFMDYKVEDYDLSQDIAKTKLTANTVQATYLSSETVTVQPADITIYMGGNGGYDAVVGDGVATETDSLPRPLFQMETPDGIKPEDLTFVNGSNSWTVVCDNPDSTGTKYYHFAPVGESENVRVTYTYTDKEENKHTITDDDFDPAQLGDVFAECEIALYPGSDDLTKVTASSGSTLYPIEVKTGTLTIRAVANEKPTSAILETAPDKPVQNNAAVAVKPEGGTSYTLNNLGVPLPDDAQPSLLFDSIIEDSETSTARTDALKEQVDVALGKTDENVTRNYEIKYLDLVDTNNGNAWITSSNGTDIYWGYPENTDQNTEFTLLHFRGLHRDGENSGFDVADIANITPEKIKIEKTETGIKFHIGAGGFSPFALVYDTKDDEPTPVPETVTVAFESGKYGDFGWPHVTSKDVELTKGDKLAAYQIPYVFEDEGYEFIGWYKQGSASWKLYSDEALLKMEFNSDATFIAQYKYVGGPSVDDEYDVVYNANFTDGGVPRRQGYDKGETVTVSENKWFERDGYIFVGWNTEADGTGDSYDPDDTFKMPGRDVYLYAQWQKEKPSPDDTGVSRWLETEDHNAYLTGYPDSTFGADRNMTRAEVAQMFYALLKNKNVMITTSFSDVSNDAWYATAVKTMASLGMMSGYPDGTFRPDEPITRAEFATVALAFAYEPDNARCSYLDVSTSAWYYTYVAQATTYGWIGGYPDGTFRPNNSITRVEVCVIVNNMLGRTPDEDYIDRNEDELVNFVDLSDRYWGYYTIMEATNGHEYTGNYSNETWESVK